MEEDEGNDPTDQLHIVIFADDNTPTTSNSDPEELMEQIQEDADKTRPLSGLGSCDN